MKGMTDTVFKTEDHPRSSASGRFVPTINSAPEATLTGSFRGREVQEVIDHVTFGSEHLQRRLTLPDGDRYDYGSLLSDRSSVWRLAGGPEASIFSIDSAVGAGEAQTTVEGVERDLEVAFYRASSGQYSIDKDANIHLAPLDIERLRDGDREATRNGEHVAAMWESGQDVGPEAEVTPTTAKLFAEDALRSLPHGAHMTHYPRLAEMAYRPYSADDGASPEKVDQLHTELHTIREARGWELTPVQRARLDALATFALHARPSQHA